MTCIWLIVSVGADELQEGYDFYLHNEILMKEGEGKCATNSGELKVKIKENEKFLGETDVCAAGADKNVIGMT